MFVSSKRSRLLLGLFPSEVVYHLKSYPQGAASLNRTVLESSDKTNPNLTRVLDVNPSLFLAREVQPPLIYLRGGGRFNNTQSINRSTTSPCSSTFISPLVSFFSFFVVLQDWRLRIHEALGAVRLTSSSQSSPRALTGSLPGERRVWSQKRRLAVLRIALEVGLPRCELRSISLSTAGTYRRVRVMRSSVNTLFGDSAGEKINHHHRPSCLATTRFPSPRKSTAIT